jgi:hypothetical protein
MCAGLDKQRNRAHNKDSSQLIGGHYVLPLLFATQPG